MNQEKKEIWIIDDHRLFSAGMKQMLANVTTEFEILCFDHPKMAGPAASSSTVSLIIMDFYIPDADTLAWISEFRTQLSDTPIIIISSSISPSDKLNSISAGASAYYPKHSSPEEILRRINNFIQPEKPTVNGDIENPVKSHNLTDRQIDILIQLSRGSSNKAIAKTFGISPETVKSHIAAIYKIISCDNRDQAITWARSKGFV